MSASLIWRDVAPCGKLACLAQQNTLYVHYVIQVQVTAPVWKV